ncbi:MAG: hypothetical protein JXR48_16020 [Candidatus Delongbacteria bacterium]|nr:hypothetical protein [Candidatus Delongbacteria bacterium]MBN2836465.1 hypothetical protein [Candidatus Delongbacteria bacterium]
MNKIVLYILILASFIFLTGQQIKFDSIGQYKQFPDGRIKINEVKKFQYGIFGINCDEGIIGSDKKSVELKGNVVLWDTLRYITCDKANITEYSDMHRAFFNDNVFVSQDSVRIWANSGRFDELTHFTAFNDSIEVRYDIYPSAMYCQSMTYNDDSGKLQSSRTENIVYIDSVYKVTLTSNEVEYNTKTNILSINKKHDYFVERIEKGRFEPNIIKKLNYKQFLQFPTDSLDRVRISTIKSKAFFNTGVYEFISRVMVVHTDSLDKITVLKCDTMHIDQNIERVNFNGNFSLSNDSVSIVGGKAVLNWKKNQLIVYNQPKLSFNDNEAIGDSCHIFYDKAGLDEINIYGSGKLLNPVRQGLNLMNTIDGRYISMDFEDNDPKSLKVIRQAQCTYYSESDSLGNYAKNIASGDTLFLEFDKKKLSKITVIGGVKGRYLPGVKNE